MTTSAVVYSFLFIHIGVILVATAYYTVGALLAPRLTQRARERFARRPWLPVVVGVALSVPWVAASLALLGAGAGPVKFVGAVLGCLWILIALFGGAGIAQHIGRGVVGGVGSDDGIRDGAQDGAWVQTFRGGLLLSLTWVLPLVGWLGMLPLTMAAGVGCFAIGLFASSAPKLPAAPPVSPRVATA